MKTLIYFNAPDAPEGVGQSQKLEGTIQEYLDANSSKFVDALIEGNKLTFTKAISEENEPIKGYALIFEVPDDFQN